MQQNTIQFPNQISHGTLYLLPNQMLKLDTGQEFIYYRYADFGERLVARLIDVLIIIIPAFIIPILAPWLYFALQHCSDTQQTVGQKVMNIKLLSSDGCKVHFGQATGRFFANWLNSLTLLIGYIIFFFSDKNQCLHDIISQTIVVSEVRREPKEL